MLDRVPTCEPIGCTTVNWPILERATHLLGRSPFEQLDKERNNSRNLWGFLAVIGEIFWPGGSTRSQVSNAKFAADLIHFSFLCTCYTDDLIDLIEDCSLTFKRRELDKYRTVFILSGTLTQFRETLNIKYSSKSSYYARIFYARIKKHLDNADLLELRPEKDLPDGTRQYIS